jgi:hypothetical protein
MVPRDCGLSYLVVGQDTYVRSLGRMLFPEYIGGYDDNNLVYAVTIRYSGDHDGDVQLKEHSVALVITVNERRLLWPCSCGQILFKMIRISCHRPSLIVRVL